MSSAPLMGVHPCGQAFRCVADGSTDLRSVGTIPGGMQLLQHPRADASRAAACSRVSSHPVDVVRVILVLLGFSISSPRDLRVIA